MFERFTSGARTVVELAQGEARTLRHGSIGTEHLLLGLLGEEHGVAARALHDAGLTVAGVRAEVTRLVDDALLDGPDADALRAIGIDVEHVRARVEEAFGPGALERARSGGSRRGLARGHVPFSPRAKKVLELSLREPSGCTTTTSEPSTSSWGCSARARGWRRASSPMQVSTPTTSAGRCSPPSARSPEPRVSAAAAPPPRGPHRAAARSTSRTSSSGGCRRGTRGGCRR